MSVAEPVYQLQEGQVKTHCMPVQFGDGRERNRSVSHLLHT